MKERVGNVHGNRISETQQAISAEKRAREIACGIRLCSRCEESKPLDQFYKERTTKWLTSQCKQCIKKVNDNWKERNPDRVKQLASEHRLMRRFGLTIEDKHAMHIAQDGKCLICQRQIPESGFICHVDHCHNTNLIRGLLCGHCNQGLGSFKDNSELLRKAADYIDAFNASIKTGDYDEQTV